MKPHVAVGRWRGGGLAVLGAVYGLFWIGGMWSYVVRGAPPTGSEWAAPVFLVLAAAWVLAVAPAREARVLALGGAIGFAAEVLGVHTGFPFGGYRYTRVLFPHLFGVPLVLACAWIVVFAHARQVMRRVRGTGVRMLSIAGWLVALDLLIDPPAAGPLGYWRWTGEGAWYGIPWTNFAGWFLVGLVLAMSAPHSAPASRTVRATGLSVVLFFTVISGVYSLWGAAAAGLLLVGIDAAFWRITARAGGRGVP